MVSSAVKHYERAQERMVTTANKRCRDVQF